MDADDTTKVLGWIGYCRKSTEEQANSIGIQTKDIKTHAERRVVPLTAIFSDALSGKSTLGRDGLAKALEALKPGYALAVVRVDRLARNTPDFFVLVATIRDKGCYLYTCDNGYYSASNSNQIIYMMASWVAEQERRTINKRTARGLQDLKERWTTTERPAGLEKFVTLPPYGYIRNKNYDIEDPRAFEEEPEEQTIITRIKTWYASERGLPYHVIAGRLNDEGVRTRSGGQWYASSVRTIVLHQGIDTGLKTRIHL